MTRRTKWRPTKNQKRIMDEMADLEDSDPRETEWVSWFSPMVFQMRCKLKRPIVTLKSLVSHGVVQERIASQMDIEIKPMVCGIGQFSLTDNGRARVERRREWFQLHPGLRRNHNGNYH